MKLTPSKRCTGLHPKGASPTSAKGVQARHCSVTPASLHMHNTAPRLSQFRSLTCTDSVLVSAATSLDPGLDAPGVFGGVFPGGVVLPVLGVLERLVVSTGSRVSGRDANGARSSVVGALMMMGGLSISCTPSLRMSAGSGPDRSAGMDSLLSCRDTMREHV